MDLQLIAVDPRGPDAQQLLAELTAEITAIYADLGYDGTGGFALADLDGRARCSWWRTPTESRSGCGALRPYDDDIAEVKRMYTVPAWRGRGVAAAVLAELERHARGFRLPHHAARDRRPSARRDPAVRAKRLSAHPAVRAVRRLGRQRLFREAAAQTALD